ncbi:hypothetical protein ABZU76_20965 [Amycolatopsis sp. NPDC005232]|uniref:hypothetical protein n=1 Tax=Amycolatopsis sp. NPDC005232 TaxID=3157027 RepID=UPI0033ABDEFD
MSSEAARMAGSDFFDALRKNDVVVELRGVIERGWITVDGAHLLEAWYRSYFGDRDRFSEVIDYEAAVNGRGIPDLDLTEIGESLVSLLLGRGVAFAWAALHQQNDDLPAVWMAAYISAGPTLFDPDKFTGNVTFCTVPLGRPGYIDALKVTKEDIVVALFSEDCRHPLPATSYR